MPEFGNVVVHRFHPGSRCCDCGEVSVEEPYMRAQFASNKVDNKAAYEAMKARRQPKAKQAQTT